MKKICLNQEVLDFNPDFDIPAAAERLALAWQKGA